MYNIAVDTKDVIIVLGISLGNKLIFPAIPKAMEGGIVQAFLQQLPL